MSAAREAAAAGRVTPPAVWHGGASHRSQLLFHLHHELHTCLTAVLGYAEHMLETIGAGAAEMRRALLAVKDTGEEIVAKVKVCQRAGSGALGEGDEASLRAARELSRGCLPLAERIRALCARLMGLAEEERLFVLVPLLCRMQAAGSMLLEVLEEYAGLRAGQAP